MKKAKISFPNSILNTMIRGYDWKAVSILKYLSFCGHQDMPLECTKLWFVSNI